MQHLVQLHMLVAIGECQRDILGAAGKTIPRSVAWRHHQCAPPTSAEDLISRRNNRSPPARTRCVAPSATASSHLRQAFAEGNKAHETRRNRAGRHRPHQTRGRQIDPPLHRLLPGRQVDRRQGAQSRHRHCRVAVSRQAAGRYAVHGRRHPSRRRRGVTPSEYLVARRANGKPEHFQMS